MDPLAHTLVGASLAETGLKRWTPLATATLVIGANLPDIDAVTTVFGSDTMLLHRRGWTHGVLAMLLLPWLLAALVYAFGRSRGRGAVDFFRLLALATIAVVSHPLLDWLNTYGVRLLMPFDGRWFYGDTLFILDPLMWLVAGSSVVVGGSLLGKRSCLVLGAVTTTMVLSTQLTPWSARLVWLAGIGAIVYGRTRDRWRTHSARMARISLAILGMYVVAMFYLGLAARGEARGWLSAHGIDKDIVMSGPRPARPFERDIVAASADRYLFLTVDWLAASRVRPSGPEIRRHPVDAVVAAALAAPAVAGLRGWMRFPAYDVEPLPDRGYRVRIRDVRYVRDPEAKRAGFASAVVELDSQLKPR